VRVKCSIFIDESVVDEAGIPMSYINSETKDKVANSPAEPLTNSWKFADQLSKLRTELEAAVEEENYEKAAMLRDKINELEKHS
jgi:protein-arginine kinase activator protein McsA